MGQELKSTESKENIREGISESKIKTNLKFNSSNR